MVQLLIVNFTGAVICDQQNDGVDLIATVEQTIVSSV